MRQLSFQEDVQLPAPQTLLALDASMLWELRGSVVQGVSTWRAGVPPPQAECSQARPPSRPEAPESGGQAPR